MAVEAARIIIDIDADSRKANADLKKVDSSLKKVDRSTKKLDADTKKYARTAKKSFATARTAYLGYAAAIGIGIVAFRAVLEATKRQTEANTRLQAVLRSTAGAAGLTYEQLKLMASGLQEVTVFGDETINEAQALLLTFTSIGEDVFPTALESILNVSTAMGQDLQQSVQQVGRALNDPIKGVAALTRVGVQFTDQQKEQIRVMQEAGDIAGAQAVILGELETQFGGLARAMAATPFGRFEQLKNTLGDIAETIGEEMLPGLGNLAEALNTAATSGGTLKEVFTGVGAVINGLTNQIAGAIEMLNQLTKSMNAFEVSSTALRRATGLTQQQVEDSLMGLTPEDIEEIFGDTPRPPGTRPPGTQPPGTIPPPGPTIDPLIADEARFREERIAAERAYYDEVKRLREADAQMETRKNEDRIKEAKETFEILSGLISSTIGGLSEVFKMAADNAIGRATNAYNRQKDLIEMNVVDEEKKASMLEALEERQAAKLASIRKEAAEKQKALAIFSAIIETAKGAVSGFAAAMPLTPPANIIVGAATVAAMTGLGAAQIALIASRPPPSAQFGGDFMIPPGNEADSGSINVNQGEVASITPVRHSENNGMPKMIVVKIGDTEFQAFIEESVDSAVNSGAVQINKRKAVKPA